MSCTYETTCPYEHVSNYQTFNLAFSTEQFDWVWNRIIWFCVFCCTEGLLQDCRLPPKKLIGTNNQEFTESKREQFETYLQVTKSDIIVKCIAATSHQICIDLTVLAWSICNLLGLDYHVIMIKFVRQNRKFCVIMIIKDERKCQLPAECPQTTLRCLSGFFSMIFWGLTSFALPFYRMIFSVHTFLLGICRAYCNENQYI